MNQRDPEAPDEGELIAIPVQCHRCGAVTLSEFSSIVVATALLKWNNMNLYVPCHLGSWDATKLDLQRIREYVGEPWLEAQMAKSIS